MPEDVTAAPAGPTPAQITKRADSDSFWKQRFQCAKSHEQKDNQNWDKYVKLFRDGEFSGLNDTTRKVSANLTFPYVNIMIAFLHAQDPALVVTHNPDGGYDPMRMAAVLQTGLFQSPRQACEAFGQMLLKVRNHIYNETRSAEHIDVCLFEAIVRGLGVAKIGWDNIRGVDRIDAIRRSEVYFDPNARYMPSQGQYIVHTPYMHIDEAEVFFGNLGVSGLKPNFSLVDTPDYSAKERGADESGPDLFKFHELWYKGPDGTRWLRYMPWDTDTWLTERMPWPFLVDEDDYPFVPLSFHNMFGAVADAFTALHVVNGLRKTYEDMFQVYHERARRTLAKKVVYDGRVFTDAKIAEMKDARQMGWVKAELQDGQSLNDVLKVIDFNSDNDPDLEMAQLAKNAHETVTAVDELRRGGQTKTMSATEADVRAENAEINTKKFQDKFDRFLNKLEEGRTQVCRQLMGPEVVARLSGQVGAMLWQVLAPDADDILKQYSVSVVAGSSGLKAKKDRMERLALQFEHGKEINEAAGGLPVIDLVAISQAIAQVGGDLEPDRFVNPQMAQIYLSGGMMPPPPMTGGAPDGQGNATGTPAPGQAGGQAPA